MMRNKNENEMQANCVFCFFFSLFQNIYNYNYIDVFKIIGLKFEHCFDVKCYYASPRASEKLRKDFKA